MSCDGNISLSSTYIISAFCLISFCLSIIVMLICLLKNILESFTSRIIICMSINDAVCSLSLFLYIILAKFMNNCILLYSFYIGFMSNYVWALYIAITLREIIINKSSHNANYFKYWLILAYPFLITLYTMPFITGSYLDKGEFCMLAETGIQSLWLYLLFIIPFYIFTIIILIILANIYFVCRKTDKNPLKTIVIKRGYIYPLLVLIIIVPESVARSIETFTNYCVSGDFTIFMLVLISSHGILNAITLVSNENIRRFLLNKSNTTIENISVEGYSFLDMMNDVLT
ncbi:hypothetical protein SteCoe_1105 [Stentor coeruleus]|uniref:G-protein coupled receptors family 2 profile 2 domain-containing protein n=1 Tax=Stentor coeruleus TaxID=5963 RepID=A0A1R2D2K7_9CILI|nr:hypothetical protein SteCoe_1105 [Stentor coeruleus]